MFWTFPDPPKKPLLSFSGNLRHILLRMHKINWDKVYVHRHSSVVWDPGYKSFGGHSGCWRWACCKAHAECYFYFLPFPAKVKVLFTFLLVSKNRYRCMFFKKAKWPSMTFWKEGYTCLSVCVCVCARECVCICVCKTTAGYPTNSVIPKVLHSFRPHC